MNRLSNLLICIGAALVLSLGSVLAGQIQKPVRKKMVLVFEPGRYRTLDDLWEHSDPIVSVVVQAARPRDRVYPTGNPLISTAFEALVVEAFKPGSRHIVPGSVITIAILGGLRDRGAYIEEYGDKEYPGLQLQVGGRYVLFLQGGPGGPEFGVSPDGVFALTNNSVTAIGHNPVSVMMRGMSASGLVSTLSRLGGVQ